MEVAIRCCTTSNVYMQCNCVHTCNNGSVTITITHLSSDTTAVYNKDKHMICCQPRHCVGTARQGIFDGTNISLLVQLVLYGVCVTPLMTIVKKQPL